MCNYQEDYDVGYSGYEECFGVIELENHISNVRESAKDLMDCMVDDTTVSPQAIAEALLCLCDQLEIKAPPMEVVKERMSYFDLGVKLSKLSART